jgi:hypothetical protein
MGQAFALCVYRPRSTTSDQASSSNRTCFQPDAKKIGRLPRGTHSISTGKRSQDGNTSQQSSPGSGLSASAHRFVCFSFVTRPRQR